MSTVGNRIDWVDVARGIGLMFVFVGYMGVSYVSAWIYTFHMPLFFFLSGMLYPGCEKYSFTEFAWRRFKGLVIPYFTLGAVIGLFYCCLYAYYNQPASAYINMLRDFLVQEHYWTVWFLTALFLSQIIYYCIDKLLHKWSHAVSLASLLVCVFGFLRYRWGWGSLPWNLDVADIGSRSSFPFPHLFGPEYDDSILLAFSHHHCVLHDGLYPFRDIPVSGIFRGVDAGMCDFGRYSHCADSC